MRRRPDLTRQRGARRLTGLSTIGALIVSLATACVDSEPAVTELEAFPLDVARAFAPEGKVTMDPRISWDGKGSLRVSADSAVVVPVIDLSDLAIDDALLVYEAKVRTRDLDGLAYLEMRCSFPNRGDFYSRGLREPLTGSHGWSSQQVRFRLRKGEVPEAIRLSLVLTGAGTAWVDAVQLLRFEVG